MSALIDLCVCGHSAGSHSHLRFNCMATRDHSHATRCSCRKFTPRDVPRCVVCGADVEFGAFYDENDGLPRCREHGDAHAKIHGLNKTPATCPKCGAESPDAFHLHYCGVPAPTDEHADCRAAFALYIAENKRLHAELRALRETCDRLALENVKLAAQLHMAASPLSTPDGAA